MHMVRHRILAPLVWPMRALRCMSSGWLKRLNSEWNTWTSVSPAKV